MKKMFLSLGVCFILSLCLILGYLIVTFEFKK